MEVEIFEFRSSKKYSSNFVDSSMYKYSSACCSPTVNWGLGFPTPKSPLLWRLGTCLTLATHSHETCTNRLEQETCMSIAVSCTCFSSCTHFLLQTQCSVVKTVKCVWTQCSVVKIVRRVFESFLYIKIWCVSCARTCTSFLYKFLDRVSPAQ